MKVSVAMITYNHEQFVAQAIESVLQQVADFEWELVIGEDGSGDATAAICEDYRRRHPARIRLLAHGQNLGMMRNFMHTLRACRGQYVAICEGDDYWVATHKLRRQAEFLDARRSHAICFHNVEIEWDGSGRRGELLCPPDQPSESSLCDIVRANFIPTPSVMFRNRLFGEFPDWFGPLRMGDWPLHILNAQHGAIGYLGEVMAVYRRHAASSFAARDVIPNYRAILEVYDAVERNLRTGCTRQIRRGRSDVYSQLCIAYAGRGRLSDAVASGIAAIAQAPTRAATYRACARALKLALSGASAASSQLS